MAFNSGALTGPLCRPGFPPIQGLETAEAPQQSLAGVLETAMKLANHDEDSDEEQDEAPKKVGELRAEVWSDNRTKSWEA